MAPLLSPIWEVACLLRIYGRMTRKPEVMPPGWQILPINALLVDWYCSEPRLAFNKTVVTRYRIALEQHPYAPSTINLRLAAIRRLASDCGLLSSDLAAGIRRVKGVRRLGVRVGNWLTAEEGKKLLGNRNR